MGSPFYLSKDVGLLRRNGDCSDVSRLLQLLEGKR